RGRRLGLADARPEPEEVLEFGESDTLGAEPAPEPGLDPLDVGQGGVGEEVDAVVGQLTLGDRFVEQLTRSPDEREQLVELCKPGSVDVGHERLRPAVRVETPPTARAAASRAKVAFDRADRTSSI